MALSTPDYSVVLLFSSVFLVVEGEVSLWEAQFIFLPMIYTIPVLCGQGGCVSAEPGPQFLILCCFLLSGCGCPLHAIPHRALPCPAPPCPALPEGHGSTQPSLPNLLHLCRLNWLMTGVWEREREQHEASGHEKQYPNLGQPNAEIKCKILCYSEAVWRPVPKHVCRSSWNRHQRTIFSFPSVSRFWLFTIISVLVPQSAVPQDVPCLLQPYIAFF